jgi:hypothetical protein
VSSVVLAKQVEVVQQKSVQLVLEGWQKVPELLLPFEYVSV